MKTTIELPLLPLRDVVVYPHMVIPLFVGREKSIEALEAAMTGDKQILLLAQKNPADDDPGEDALYRVGTIATVLQLLKLPDGTVKVLVEGEQRGAVERFMEVDGHLRAEVALIEEVEAPERESEVFVRSLLSQFEQYVQLGKKVPAEVLSSLNSIDEPSRLVDTMAAHMALKIEQKQDILEIIDLSARVEHVLAMLDGEIDLLQVEKRIRGRVKKQMERSQREYYLNEQMKAIQKELGDGEEGHNEIEELKKRIDAAGLPKDALTKATAELNKLKQMSPMSAEATVVRSYIDWLVQVPWKAQTKVRLDLARAEEILDADHYGLEEVKERILEYLAVQKRVKKIRGPVLCLVGPPGVGKTSLAESIASATNRKFVRMALGGVRDEAEIRGHRRTYIGSMPGRLIQKMTKVGVRNPLFLLDEIDKMGSDMRGDPASALLEVLDPEQNHNFNDHYLEVDYDLSDVMFLCTSNSMNIPPALLDRMEVIRLPGYTEDEKINIAVKYLAPKQISANGLKKGEIEFEVEAIRDIVRYYTREAGVRGLERQIAKICRKAVKEHALEKRFSVKVVADSLEHFLGVKKFRYGLAEQQDQVGQVTGLAWTQVGGELLTIEAAVIPGKGQLIKTGSLGDVMVESITAAQTVVRSRARSLGIPLDFHEKHDTHIHMPEGATPKDGPSAGVGMCTALVSALTGIPVRADVAMTGEITLRGQVLAIGGLKEKLLAAHRGGIKTVIIPEENVRDLKEIPDNIKQDLQIKPVKWIDEVLQIALQYAPEPLPDVAPEIVAKDEKRESDSKERISTH
ncbi:MAG: endopeptidase La [Pseudomonadales bacterium RIFCSPLOWO2_12_60_38]|uniref:Lon protease n=5 Tax=Pseudomonas TaxID=286 RepID=B7TX41_PSEFL|nr:MULTISPECIES: endopeptidase La [Pseudomonas]ACJ50518.1 ATP-dependent lon protease [Pseudomonas fluorescens SS101]AFJ55436.1 ATP-dependent protease La [Pseudomonas fluorescens A506]ETK39913.1 peptidase [Pseudomonas fluorescens FH5]MDN5431369.1 endopeptidase La [Pseudomonadales bacterium]OHC32015.1 MAG: endopeptidase La [Pseudomonadales bacterium RIFCSPLOWO2_12_60_38]OHC38196.1 MAG: endopeptidase La [Pseudomonadales bacterium RIFCSPLOWO2_12_FULL_59_450]PMZ70766.1 endopeptidase La [Pseudomon